MQADHLNNATQPLDPIPTPFQRAGHLVCTFLLLWGAKEYLLDSRSTRRKPQRRCAASLRRLSSFSTLNLKPATPSPRSRHVQIAAWKKIESFWPQERECHLWREHFPHLRLLGRGIPLIPPTTTTTTTANTTTATSTIGNNNSSALSVTRLRPSDPNDRLRHSGGSRQRPSAPRRGRHPPPVDVSQVSFRDFCWQLGSAWDWTNYWTLEEVLTALYRYFLLGHQPRKLASLVKLHSDNICLNMLTIVPSCSQAAKICWESSGDLCIAVDLSPLCIILRTGVRRPLRSTAATKRTARATWPTRPGVGCWATSLRRSRRNTSRRNCSTPSWSSCWSAFTKPFSFDIFRFRLVWRRRCSQQCRSTVSGLQLRWELVQSQPGWSSDFTRVNLAAHQTSPESAWLIRPDPGYQYDPGARWQGLGGAALRDEVDGFESQWTPRQKRLHWRGFHFQVESFGFLIGWIGLFFNWDWESLIFLKLW